MEIIIITTQDCNELIGKKELNIDTKFIIKSKDIYSEGLMRLNDYATNITDKYNKNVIFEIESETIMDVFELVGMTTLYETKFIKQKK